MKQFHLKAMLLVVGLTTTCCAHEAIWKAPAHEAPNVHAFIRHDTKTDVKIGEIDFHAAVDQESVAIATNAMKWFDKQGVDQILIDLDTPGGGLDEGKKLALAMETTPTRVTCVVSGEAASMGFYLFESCDERLMMRHARLMVHEPHRGTTMLDYPVTRKWLMEQMTLHEQDTNEYLLHAVRRMKRSEADVRKKVYTDDWWLDSQQAIDEGASDGICVSVQDVRDDLLRGDQPYFFDHTYTFEGRGNRGTAVGDPALADP